jgi:hypothetical protein
MLPAHVGGLDDALFYLREWVEWLGAIHRSVEQPVTGIRHRDRLARVMLLPTEFRFADGRRLAARATIDARLRPVRYAFNSLEYDGAHLWAFHYHPGHDNLGGWAHAHLTEGDHSQVHAASVVIFEEILERVQRR